MTCLFSLLSDLKQPRYTGSRQSRESALGKGRPQPRKSHFNKSTGEMANSPCIELIIEEILIKTVLSLPPRSLRKQTWRKLLPHPSYHFLSLLRWGMEAAPSVAPRSASLWPVSCCSCFAACNAQRFPFRICDFFHRLQCFEHL